MSKVTEALNAKGIHNEHNLVDGHAEQYMVRYVAYENTMGSGFGWYLASPVKKWKGAWYDHGNFSIRGVGGCKDAVLALRTASKESGVLRWSPSPFSPRTAFVPTSVLEAHGIKPTRVFDFSPTERTPE